MKSLLKKSTAIAAVIAAAGLTLQSASAGHDEGLIHLSHELEELAGSLHEEFGAHYSHTSAYRHLLADASSIAGRADHIHRLAHDPRAYLIHIEADLRQLDELAHHLHELVDVTDAGHYGHVHGDSRHVHTLMASLTGVIHSMESEVQAMQRPACQFENHHYGSQTGYTNGYRSYGREINFGGGSIRFFRP